MASTSPPPRPAVDAALEPTGLVSSEVIDVPPELVPALALQDAVVVEERSLPRRLAAGLIGLMVTAVGGVSLIVGLALLATVPVVNLLSLGYLLEASGRVGRTGRLRNGFIGLRPAALIGGIVFAAWLSRWPLLFVSEMWSSAYLIDPTSSITRNWALGWTVAVCALAIGVVLAVALVAWLRPAWFVLARDWLWELCTRRLPYYFLLGLGGFIGGLAWLVVPISILAAASQLGPVPSALLSLLGGIMLATVVAYLPFLQAHYAAQRRFGALFEWLTVRQQFRRAPIAFWFSLLASLLFALPLYLLMIELLPHEVTWLPSVLFVVFLFPARLLTGWAYARASRRQLPRLWLSRWLARLAAIPVVGFYAFFVWLSQYLLWYGVGSLYHQHAFLVPVPFLGM